MPRPPVGAAFAGGKKAKNQGKTIRRILSYISGGYRVRLVVVLCCILLSALANVIGSMFLPVSYTHLDVYKRQIWDAACGIAPNGRMW